MSAPTAAFTKNEAMPRPTPCFFLNASLRRSRSAITARHVDLVERREHGGGALRLDEPARDRGAPLGHAHALFACGRRGAPGRGGVRRRSWAAAVARRHGRRRRRGGAASHELAHVLLGHARAASPAPPRGCTACSRATFFAVGVAFGAAAAAGAGAPRRLARAAAAGRRRRPLRRRRAPPALRPPSRRRLRGCLMLVSTPARSALTSRSIFSVSSSTSASPSVDLVALLLQPARDARLDDRLAQFRHHDVHHLIPSEAGARDSACECPAARIRSRHATKVLR